MQNHNTDWKIAAWKKRIEHHEHIIDTFKSLIRRRIKRLESKDKKIIHHTFDHYSKKPTTLCGAIPRNRDKDGLDSEYENSTIFSNQVTCEKCLRSMRSGGRCPICGISFDHSKETYCGNCGKNTRGLPMTDYARRFD
jgi:hypothetical protein